MTGVIAALAQISKPITAKDICTMQNDRLNSTTIGKYGDCMETKGTNMEWQPIETAPKDGTHVLGFWKFSWCSAFIIEVITYLDGKFVASWDYDDGVYPSHWMPLPKPPTK